MQDSSEQKTLAATVVSVFFNLAIAFAPAWLDPWKPTLFALCLSATVIFGVWFLILHYKLVARWLRVTLIVVGLLLIGAGILMPLPGIKPVAPQSDSDPFVEVTYALDMIGLPIVIPANSTVPIIHVRENRVADLVQHQGDKSADYLWPAPKVSPPVSVGVLSFENQSDSNIYALQSALVLDIGGTKEALGVKTVSIQLPVFDLKKNEPFRFFVVNQSKTGGIVHVPTHAQLRVQGESERRQISLRQRNVTFFDKVPMLPFQSIHEWQGDKIVKPDLWPTPKKKK